MIQIKDYDINNFVADYNSEYKFDSNYNLKQSFPEAYLYALLKHLFGDPNGFHSMILGTEGDSDAPWKWSYSLKSKEGFFIIINRSWLSIEILYNKNEVNIYNVEKFLSVHIKIFSREIEAKLNNFEKYKLIINPYFRHKSMAEIIFEKLSSIKSVEPYFPNSLYIDQKQQKNFNKQFLKYIKNSNETMLYSMNLVTESAFMIESVLNLFISFNAKSVLREDAALYRSFLYERWSSKVKKLTLYCDNIHSIKDEEILRFDSVFKLRNSIAHSYPDKKELCINKMWFDKNIPILPKSEPFPLFQTGFINILPTKSQAIECYNLALEFIELLKKIVDDQYKGSFDLIMATNPIGWNESTNQYGIPFGPKAIMPLFDKNSKK